MEVFSNKSVSFPTLNWGINAGCTRKLPKDKKACEVILAHSAISEVKKGKVTSK